MVAVLIVEEVSETEGGGIAFQSPLLLPQPKPARSHSDIIKKRKAQFPTNLPSLTENPGEKILVVTSERLPVFNAKADERGILFGVVLRPPLIRHLRFKPPQLSSPQPQRWFASSRGG